MKSETESEDSVFSQVQSGELSRRKRRQIKEALRKTEQRWYNLFSLLHLPAISGRPEGAIAEANFHRAMREQSAKRVQDVTGMPVHECQLLLGQGREQDQVGTASIAWLSERELLSKPSGAMRELQQCQPSMLVLCGMSDRENSKLSDMLRCCENLQIPAVLVKYLSEEGTTNPNSKSRVVAWSSPCQRTELKLKELCPDGLMKRNQTTKLLGAVASLLFAVDSDQIYQCYLYVCQFQRNQVPWESVAICSR